MSPSASFPRPVAGRSAVDGALDAVRRRRTDHPDRRRERELCRCGLVAVGYRASWAIRHLDSCPAATLFDGR